MFISLVSFILGLATGVLLKYLRQYKQDDRRMADELRLLRQAQQEAGRYRRLAERLGRELELYRLIGNENDTNGDAR